MYALNFHFDDSFNKHGIKTNLGLRITFSLLP